MFMWPITFTRLTTSSRTAAGSVKMSNSTPSIRIRTTTRSSYGCTWMSDASC